jgi:epoxyqueuosine reductase
MAFTYRRPERSTDPRTVLPSAQAVVAGAWAYGHGDVPPAPVGRPQGRVARYAWGAHYQELTEALGRVADVLRAEGWRAVVSVDQNHLVDRPIAHRAGLGWYGKSGLLLLPAAGSWFVLGSVVTDAPLAPTADEPVADGCGSCTRCMTDCPTGAIVAPGVVDARRCLAWIVQAPGDVPREHRAALGDRIYGCDECQDVCPPNRVELRRTRRGPVEADAGPVGQEAEAEAERPADPEPAAGEGPWVDLLDLLEADDATLLDRHGRWYIAGRDPRWLRRNALVALGNVGDPSDERVAAALRGALAGEDGMLAAHAVWAARRLDRADLLAVIPPTPPAEVIAELDAPAPEPRSSEPHRPAAGADGTRPDPLAPAPGPVAQPGAPAPR